MSIWQTKKWWDMLIKSWQAKKIIELDGIFIEKRSIWLWEYWLFVLWFKWVNLWEDLEKKLKEICKQEKALFIQIETINYNWDKFKTYNFKKWYYKKFITPFAALIDLEKLEDDILAEMKPKWRYNIKLAEKKWVEVKIIDKTDENTPWKKYSWGIKKFYNLVLETTSRDKFNWNTFDYYKTFLNLIEESELLLAYADDGEVIAWWIFVFWDEASIYYYWTSTSNKKYRNLMAPYLLQWEAIKIAKEKGSRIYDFLWVSSPWEINSELEWVTSFKLKLTKNVVNVSDSYIWINKKFKYNILNIFRKIKNLIK